MFGIGAPELIIILLCLIVPILKGWLFARVAKAVGKSYGLYFLLGIFPISDFIALMIFPTGESHPNFRAAVS